MTIREPDEWPTRIGAITLFVEDVPAANEFYRTVFGLPVHYEDADSAVFKFGDTLVNLLKATEAAELTEPEPVAPPNAGSQFQRTILSEPGVAPVGPTDRQQEFVVRIYLAGPFFTTPEREWNVGLAARLRAGGHESSSRRTTQPRSGPGGRSSARTSMASTGRTPSWRSWTGRTRTPGRAGSAATRTRGKTVVLFRSDFRGSGDERDIPYNAMLIGAADAHIELELATLDEAAAAILTTLAGRSKGSATALKTC